jgi:hypothetical protein
MNNTRRLIAILFTLAIPFSLRSEAAEFRILLSGAGDGWVYGDEIGCPWICRKTFAGQLTIHLTSILRKDVTKADTQHLDFDLPLESREIILKAVPEEWATFAGWHVNGIPTDETTVILEHDTIVKATFHKTDWLDKFVLFWYRNNHREYAVVALDEFQLFLNGTEPFGEWSERQQQQLLAELRIHFHPQVRIIEYPGQWIHIVSPAPLSKAHWRIAYETLPTIASIRVVEPLLYRDIKNRYGRVYILDQISVEYPHEYGDEQIQAIEQEYGLERTDVYTYGGDVSYTYGARDLFTAVEVANQLYESGRVMSAYPDIAPNVAPL